jgi:ATP-binding cassette subfamily B protein
MLVGPGIMYPSTTIVVTIMALYSMFSVDATLTVTLLVPIMILSIYVNFNTRKLHKYYRQAQEYYSDMTARIQENFSGIRVIKAYCQEEAEFNRFREINDRYLERNVAQIKLRGRLFPFMKFVGGVGVVLILWQGGLKVIDGDLRLGDLIQFTIYYQMLMWPIIALGWIINVIHRGMASWKRLQAILVVKPDIDDSTKLNEESGCMGEIEFRNLTFSYGDNSPPVLKNISFHVHPGQTLAVVGPTGSGKSTIVNLLLHLYPVPPGSVFFDGRDINDMRQDDLWKSIAYVSQEVFLFSDTIRENILFGVAETESVNEAALMAASECAQLHREVEEFPDHYETEVGERGITLSGGQKQRTGIARALILNRPILILDDCLSNVDTQTEEAILRGLQDAIHRSTTIVISHRISTVKHADHIIVLDEGCIVEEGDHDSLIAEDGLYARIYRRQLLEESLGIRS